IITIYCWCDDLLHALQHAEDAQCTMHDAEVMTIALVAASCFRGNFEQARAWLSDRRFIPAMLSKCRFNRRVHRLDTLFVACFQMLAEVWKHFNASALYILD
ncbi:MAG: IS982 family transposase, partial [Chloroflexi bacterium]|nr:IS982 family transposase [Chloroflexota bacterium]